MSSVELIFFCIVVINRSERDSSEKSFSKSFGTWHVKSLLLVTKHRLLNPFQKYIKC